MKTFNRLVLAVLVIGLLVISGEAQAHHDYQHSDHGWNNHDYGRGWDNHHYGHSRNSLIRGVIVGGIIGTIIYESNRDEYYPPAPMYYGTRYVNPPYVTYIRVFDENCGCYVIMRRDRP